MNRIVLASNNSGKIREIRQVMMGLEFEIVPQSEFDIGDVEETGLSFIENALIKARHASTLSGLPAIADDSGIEIDALNGDPGIYSARYAGLNSSDLDNNNKLLNALQDVPEDLRTARFQCVIVYMHHARDSMPAICMGTWAGRILHQPQGPHGFGYDPLFYVPTHNCASAELAPEVKNQISHRAQALRVLKEALRNGNSITLTL